MNLKPYVPNSMDGLYVKTYMKSFFNVKNGNLSGIIIGGTFFLLLGFVHSDILQWTYTVCIIKKLKFHAIKKLLRLAGFRTLPGL